MAVSKRLRYEVLRRDEYACRYCGARAPEVALTVDHVTPIALGGTNDPTNLVDSARSPGSTLTETPAGSSGSTLGDRPGRDQGTAPQGRVRTAVETDGGAVPRGVAIREAEDVAANGRN